MRRYILNEPHVGSRAWARMMSCMTHSADRVGKLLVAVALLLGGRRLYPGDYVTGTGVASGMTDAAESHWCVRSRV